MINNVNDLIEIYSLDKPIKDTSPVYRDYAIKVYTLYICISNRIKHMNLNTTKLPMQDVSVIEDNDKLYEGLRDTAFFCKMMSALVNQPELAGLPPEKVEKIKQVNQDLKELEEENAGIESEVAKISTVVNNANLPKDIHAYVSEQLENVKNTIELNKQTLRGAIVKPVESKVQLKSDSPRRFVFLDDYNRVIYGPCTSIEASEICKSLRGNCRLEEYAPLKDYKYCLMSKNDLLKANDFSAKNDFNWMLILIIGTILLTVVGMIKCYLL